MQADLSSFHEKVSRDNCRKLLSIISIDIKRTLLETLNTYPVGENSMESLLVQLSLYVKRFDPELSRQLIKMYLDLKYGSCDNIDVLSKEFRELLRRVRHIMKKNILR